MGNPPVNPPVNPPANQVQVRGEGIQVFREIVTAVIAIAILSLTVWMLADTYNTGRQPFDSTKSDKAQHDDEVKAKADAYNRQKDLLLYALALLGTVTGYYLGRVPAEQRAQQAQQTANTAQTQLATAHATAVNAANTAVEATKEAESAKLAVVEATKEAESAKHRSSAATTTLDSIRKKLSTTIPSDKAKTLSASSMSPEQKTILEIQKEIDDFLAER